MITMMWTGKISFCLLLWQSITLMSSARNRTQAVRLCLFCDHSNHSNTPQAKHFPWLFPLSLTNVNFPDFPGFPGWWPPWINSSTTKNYFHKHQTWWLQMNTMVWEVFSLGVLISAGYIGVTENAPISRLQSLLSIIKCVDYFKQ